MLTPTKVMIVETDPKLQADLAKILRASPHATTSEAVEPEDAMQLYAKTRPDVVITRLVFAPKGNQPRLGGIDLMRLLKTVDEKVKVIVSYDVNTKYLVMNAKREGAAGQIMRPYKYQAVLRAIGDVVHPDSGGGPLVKLKDPVHVKYKVAGKWLPSGQKDASTPSMAFDQIVLNMEEELAVGTQLKLEIELPRLKAPLTGEAEVQTVTERVPGYSYECNCALSGLSAEAKRKLDVFLVWGSSVGEG